MHDTTPNRPTLRLTDTEPLPVGNALPKADTATRAAASRPSVRLGAAPEPVAVGIELPPLRPAAAGTEELRRMNPDDARWVFAVRVSQLLEGGREAVLTPVRRRRLVTLAGAMGLRPFDANLVIAIVQDAVRSGKSVDASLEERLGLVRPAPAKRAIGPRVLAAAAVVIAMVSVGLHAIV